MQRYSPWILLAGVLAGWPGMQHDDCRAAQSPEDSNSAQLVIAGENVLSVILEDGSGRMIALVASPDAQTTVYRRAPAGPAVVTDKIPLPSQGGMVSLAPEKYRWNSVIVAEANHPARFMATNRDGEWFTLSAGRTRSLALGGPLRQHLAVSRCGPALDCAYQLFGAGGESYRPAPAQSPSQSSAQPKAPELTILKNGQKIHVGSFRYG